MLLYGVRHAKHLAAHYSLLQNCKTYMVSEDVQSDRVLQDCLLLLLAFL